MSATPQAERLVRSRGRATEDTVFKIRQAILVSYGLTLRKKVLVT